MDDYLRFPIVKIVKSTSKNLSFFFLKIIFVYGMPEILKTDNDPPFKGYDITRFCTSPNLCPQTPPPPPPPHLWPCSNILAESMKPLNKAVFDKMCQWEILETRSVRIQSRGATERSSSEIYKLIYQTSC